MIWRHRHQIAANLGKRTILGRIWPVADHATALSTAHHCDPHHRAQQLNDPARLEPDGAHQVGKEVSFSTDGEYIWRTDDLSIAQKILKV
jgi:hypothetical protein